MTTDRLPWWLKRVTESSVRSNGKKSVHALAYVESRGEFGPTAHVSDDVRTVIVIDGLHSSLYKRQSCTSERTVSTSMTFLVCVCVYSIVVLSFTSSNSGEVNVSVCIIFMTFYVATS